MTRISRLSLVKETVTTDAIGQIVTNETETELIGEVRSISRQEFTSARQNGITPSFVFLISIFGYNGEKIVKYKGDRYSIYRTYETDDNYIELYAETETGTTYG